METLLATQRAGTAAATAGKGSANPLIRIQNLSHNYADHRALDQVSLQVEEGSIFGLLGPNGGGKTTLFRILSTLIPAPSETVFVFGHDLACDVQQVREKTGVIFQSPSLDKKLTVSENLRHQGHLYGLRGASLTSRMAELLERVGLSDRRGDIVEKLSGGLQRRAELAKAFLHRPRLLLLDEPSTGLDPGARKDLWEYLNGLKKNEGVTILVTTHLMEEAEHCDRLGILDRGKLIAADTPDKLRAQIGGEVIVMRSGDSSRLAVAILERFKLEGKVVEDTVRLDRPRGHELIPQLVEAFGGQIESISLGRPTLEDVFIQLTGHRFWKEGSEVKSK